MTDIRIPNESIAGLVTEAVLVILIPIIALLVWKLKTKRSIKPALVGMLIWPLFGIVLKLIPGYFLLIADNPLSRLINSDPWLYAVIGGGLLAGIFEEGGRFFAYKVMLRKYGHSRDAITYGIGHGGIESVYIGFSMLSLAAMGLMVNSMGMASLTAGMDAATQAAATAQLEGIAAGGFFTPAVLGTIERISAIVFHIALSVIVFLSARDRKRLWLFPMAILIHTAANSCVGFVNTGMVSAAVFELIFAAFAVGMAVLAWILARKWEKDEA